MNLSEKMFARSTATCPSRSDCKKKSFRERLESLFDKDWEVFVIRRDTESGSFDWFTLCCEGASFKDA